MNNWEIIDENGVVHSGTESEMDAAWDVMTSLSKESYIDNFTNTYPEDILAFGDLYDKYECDNWEGNIKLIEIHKIYKQ